MCNLSEAVEERGIQKGIRQGMHQSGYSAIAAEYHEKYEPHRKGSYGCTGDKRRGTFPIYRNAEEK